MAKRTWDDVLRDRGFDPDKRKQGKTDVSYKSKQQSTISQIKADEAARKAQATLPVPRASAKIPAPAVKQPAFETPIVSNVAEQATEPKKDPSVLDRLKLYGNAIKKMFTGEVDITEVRLPTAGSMVSSVIKGEDIKMPEANNAPIVKNNLQFTKEDLAKELGVYDKYTRDTNGKYKLTSDTTRYIDHVYNKLENLNSGTSENVSLEQAKTSPVFADVKKQIEKGTNYDLYKTQKTSEEALKAWWESTKGTAKTLMGMMATQDLGRRPGEGLFANTIDAELAEREKKGTELLRKGAEDFMKSGEIRQDAIAGEDFLTKAQFDVVQNIPDMAASAVLAMATGGGGTAAKAAASGVAKSLATSTSRKALLKQLAMKAGKALLVTPETIPLALKSFASSYQDNLGKGLSEDKALTNALIKAYGEGLLEKGGVQSFVKTPKKGVAGWLASGGFEGSEEITQDMWSNIIDNLYGQKVPILTGDSFYSGLIGAITGWGVGAPMITSNTSHGIKVGNDGVMSVQTEDGTAVQVDLNNLSKEQLETISKDPAVKQDESASAQVNEILDTKVTDETATSVEPAPTEDKIAEPAEQQPKSEPVTSEQEPTINKLTAEKKIETLKRIRMGMEEGSVEHNAISKRIAALEAEQKGTGVPMDKAQPVADSTDPGKTITPESAETDSATSEGQIETPTYNEGETVTINDNGTEREVEIVEIDGDTVIAEVDGTPRQYSKKKFNEMITGTKEGPAAETKPAEVKPIDASKYGHNGRAAFTKWSKNEYINADLAHPEKEYTQKWVKLFDKYYDLGRNNKPMPGFGENMDLEVDFPPFILDTIYNAGKADYDLQQKRDAKKAEKQKENKPVEDKGEKAPEEKSDNKPENIGYHAGDLGKAEYFGNFYGLNRGTGHFGTGTYFVGNKNELDGSYKDRPLHEVDLSDYKLYTPKTVKDAETLHDILKFANTYFEYRNMKHLDYDDIRSVENDPEAAHKLLTEYGVFDDAKFKEDSGYTYQEVADGELWNRKIYDAFEKQIWNLKNLNTTIGRALNGKRQFNESIEHLFGISAEKADFMLQGIYDDVNAKMQGKNFYNMGDMKTADSISTQFMKALGYEGVDVRHIPEFDNTTYGTVVYDLRENKKAEPTKTVEKPVDAKQENGGIIEEQEGESNGENAVSSDENRADISETPENIPPKDVQGSDGKRGTGKARLSDTGGTEGRNGKSDAGGRAETGSSLGDNSTENTDTSGAGTGEQHTGNQPGNVQLNQHSNQKGTDYVINSQEDSIIDNGKKTRYKSNSAAIKLMKQIEAEGRPATAEEQKVLAKYVGWGGIPEVFSTEHTYNRETGKYESKPKKDWESEYNELKELLTEEEYQQANETILNAHYTSIDVIKGMYEGLKHFGFNGGRVLEPAVGIGNFVGSMPAEMRSNVKVMTGIEIDSVTGRIAKLLYPNADIRVQGFEKAKLPTGYYDVAISNVPFGKIAINDTKYPNSITRSIHNYFFAKALDVVRPGGIVMFITSSKTMDSKDTSGIRAYIKSRADLIGAIRLPNTAFKENAGTEVTTDIIILKVREANTDYAGEAFFEMVSKEVKADGANYTVNASINEYYEAHPENVMGELMYGRNMYAGADVFVKGDGRNIREGIIAAVRKMPSNIITRVKREESISSGPKTIRDSSKGTKEGSYEVVNGKLTINRDGKLVEVDKKASDKEIKAISKLIEIKNKARELLDSQRNNVSESKITEARKQLNKLYDNFAKEYGYINKVENTKLIADDPDVSFLLSLEDYTKPKKENKSTGSPAVKEAAKKGDIFFKNTVSPVKRIERVETAKEALIVSLNERGIIDINRMSELTGKDEKELAKDLAGFIYKNPITQNYEPADEYLSGNVKAKLREAEAYAINEPEYTVNVEALKAVQPADKEAWQISLKLGSSLIGEDTYMEFAKHLFGPNSAIEIHQMRQTGEWTVKEAEGKGKGRRYFFESIKNSTRNTVTWGINKTGFKGLNLLEKVMNNKSIIVNETYTDENGNKIKVNNPEATALAQERAEKMKEEFIKWLNEHEGGNTIASVVQQYNDVYNTDVLREFDGSHLPDTLEGMNPDIKLASHQKDAVWRIISSGGSTLLAHEVGAGKTFEMVAAAMEMKRLGIIKKPMFCVPNNVYEQWGIEFRRLYPGAKILLPTKEEMKKKNRRIFMNRIATGSYDAVIIPESQFSMLPMSIETVTEFYSDRIREMETAIEIEIAENGKGTQTEKKITQSLKNLRTKMEKKVGKMARDANNIDFEELGIDALFVDEAHRFKNLMYTTRLQVSGLGNPEGSDKAFDLLMKTRYLQNLNSGRGVVFATATPLLNSIAEVYNWQQYLCPEQLHSRGIYSFDAWASIFAKIENIAEVKPEGTGYRIKSGVSKITNVGQLAKMFREFTDFKTQDMLKLPRPDVKNGKYEVISIPGTSWLEDYMKDLADRAEAVRGGRVDPSEDNMLKITTDGRKAALYPGLVDPSFEAKEGERTKIDVAADHLFEQWNKTKRDRLTHLVFLEFSTPKAEKDTTKSSKQSDNGEESGDVDNALDSVYQEFKRKLIAKGIPAKEIAFIHDAKNSDQKINLKNRFNAGEIRILIGNNEKMGVGIDLQKRTKTITHIDFPWRPKDLQQEDGRGLRQGNMNKEIEMYVLVTEGSFDARLWDNLQRKSKLVDDMLTSDLDAVEIEDVGVQTLSAQEVVGIASGNPLMQEQIIVNQKVNKLRALEKGYRRDKRENQKKLLETETALKGMKNNLSNLKKMADAIIDTTADKFKIVIEGNEFTERKEAEAYLDQIESENKGLIKQEGAYQFDIQFAGVINRGKFIYRNASIFQKEGIDCRFFADKYEFLKDGTLQGLETTLRNIHHNVENLEKLIAHSEKEIEQLRNEIEREFPHTEELRKLTLREQELMRILNPEQVMNVAVETDDDSDDVQGFSSTSVEMPHGDGSSTSSKTVDDLIKIIEKHTGVPIRTGKYRHSALGIFKVQPEVIRTKVRGDIPAISHELGHYLDKKFAFSVSKEFKNELLKLGAATSKPSYEPKQIRAEGVAEFIRLYLTNPVLANKEAPLFMAHFEKTLDADTLSFLGMLRKEISAIKNLPNNKKIWNDISSGEDRKVNGDAVSKAQKFYDAWINEQGIFAKLESYAESKGWQGKNIDIMAQIYKGFEAKAMNMLFDKQRDLNGDIIGDSFMEIMEPLSPKAVKERTGKRSNAIQEKKDFITYMVSRRAMDYKDRGLVMPQPWYVYEDNILTMEDKYPHFQDVFDKLRKWEDNNLQLLVDSGIKTKADIKLIKYMNANHVPLYRIRDAAEAIRAGSGNTLGQSKNVIKRAKGSGATIIDPLESMISDSFIIRRAAESNNIMRVLYDMASDVEGIGGMVEKVPPGGTKTSFTVGEIRKQMLRAAGAEIEAIKAEETSEEQQKDLKRAEDYKKAIEDMSDEQLESVMSIYRPLFREKDNEVTVYVDGQKKLLQVDPQLHKAIKGLNREQMNIIMRALNAIKKVKQAGVVTSIPFVLRNFMRDTGTSLIQSEAGINPVDIMKGYASAIAKDKWYKEWVAAGGATEYVNINSRRQVQKIEDEVLQFGVSEKAKTLIEAIQEVQKNNNARTRGKLMNAARNMVDIPVDMIRDAVEWSEAGARIAEFRKAVEKGVDKQTAAAWSRKLSVDFLRHGYTGKQVNAVVAFFNANVQGVVRIGETFKAHPVKTLVRGFVYVTLPTMILYAFNRDDEEYQNLPEWRRSMFWNIPLGNGKFMSIPKPPGWGWIFGSLPEFTMNKILDNDPEAWNDIMSTFIESFKFPTEVSAISPAIDVWANKSWNDSPIEGKYERDNKPAYLIRDERTSLLSSMIGDTVKNHKYLSPKQIDYLIKQYLGSVGDFFWRLPDTIKSGFETPADVTQYPVIKSFITDATYSSESVNNLYDIGEELDLRRKELKETGRYPAMSHLPLAQQKKLFASLEAARTEYNHLADEFENARKAIKKIRDSEDLTPTVKKMKERAIRTKMNKMAADFNDKYRKFKQKHNIK